MISLTNVFFTIDCLDRQDSSVRTVLVAEREMFLDIRVRLSALLERQITEFRYYFPFGRPEGALKQTLSLLERVRSYLNHLELLYY